MYEPASFNFFSDYSKKIFFDNVDRGEIFSTMSIAERRVMAELFMARVAYGFYPSDVRIFALYPYNAVHRNRRNSHEDAVVASKQLCVYATDAYNRKRRISYEVVFEASKRLCGLKNAAVCTSHVV